MQKYLVSFAAMILLIAVSVFAVVKSAGPNPLEQTLGKAVVHEILESKGAKIHKLSKDPEGQLAVKHGPFHFYVTDLKLAGKEFKDFKAILLSNESYIFHTQKRCVFVPQIAYQMSDVTVLLSFSCQQALFIKDGHETVLDLSPKSSSALLRIYKGVVQ